MLRILPNQVARADAWRWVAALVLVLLVSTDCKSDENRGDSPSSRDPLAESIARKAEQWRSENGVAALIIGIDSPELGTTVLPSGSAEAGSSSAVDESDQFRVGSVTKTFTAAAILKLAEEGHVNLDDSLAEHLPDLPVPFNDQITIRSLLSSRTGLVDYEQSPGFFDVVGANLERTWTPEEVITQFGSAPPQFAPGEGYSYSSTNFLLLALIAEAVTGQPFAEILDTRLFRALGMSNTALAPGSLRVHGYTTKYAGLFGQEDRLDVHDVPGRAIASISGASGSAASSAPDLLTWARALYAGDLLTPGSRDQMLAFDPVFGPYGLGTFRFDTRHGWAVGHGGEYIGFTSLLLYFPDRDLAIVALANADATNLLPLIEDVLDDVLGSEQVVSIVDGLIEMLNASAPDTRREAALELGKASGADAEAAVAALVKALLADESPEVRGACALALGLVGIASPTLAAEALTIASDDSDASVREAAALALALLDGGAPP